MMKKMIIGALLALSGCVQVDDFTSVVKHPAPEGLAGNWQTVGRKAVWSVLRPF
jgi:hypothetical protein